MPLRPADLGADRPALDELFDEIERLDGYEPLTEDAQVAMGEDPAAAGLVATEGEDVVGYAHLRRRDDHTVLETAIHPACRPVLAHLLLQAAAHEAGPGRLQLWVSEDETLAAAEELGFAEGRRLLHLGRPLPPGEPARLPDVVEVTRFRPDRDVEAFLEVNNTAFAGHPDNGGWSADTLRSRMLRRWFDPDGLFILREADRPLGLCWTKLHPRAVGEIYAIAVHPRAQRRSLGTGLTLVGLWDLHDRGGADSAILYTDSDNLPARRLYERLGFRVLRVKRCLERPSISGR